MLQHGRKNVLKDSVIYRVDGGKCMKRMNLVQVTDLCKHMNESFGLPMVIVNRMIECNTR